MAKFDELYKKYSNESKGNESVKSGNSFDDLYAKYSGKPTTKSQDVYKPAVKASTPKTYTSKRMEDMGINNNNADNSVNGLTRTLTAASAAVPRYGASIMEDLRMGNEFANTYQPNGGSISDYALEQYNQGKLTGASKDAVEKYLGNQQITKDSVKKYADLSDSMTRAGEATLNESMRGLDTTTAKGKLASQALQAVSSATENLLDAGVGGAIGLGGAWNYIPFAARSFGMSAQEARNSGADLSTQLDYALAQTAKEIGTEMMWGVGNIYGKGALDDLAEGQIKKLIRNSSMSGAMKNIADVAAQLGLSFTSEGLEEAVGDVIEGYFIKQMIDPNAAPPTGEDLWNSIVVGGLSGMMMGGGNVLSQSMNAKVNNTQGRSEQILRDALNTESYDAQMLARDMQGKSYLTSDLQELENLTAQDRFRAMQESYDKQAEESRKVSPETMQELLRQGTAYGSQTAQANAGSENVAKADLAQIARDITTAQNKVAQSDLVKDVEQSVISGEGNITDDTAKAILENPQAMEYLGIKTDNSSTPAEQMDAIKTSVKELASRNAERIKAINDNIQSQKKRAEIADFANNLKLGKEGESAISKVVGKATNAEEQLAKARLATKVYNAGVSGASITSVNIEGDTLTQSEISEMYAAGEKDGQNSIGNGKRQNNLGKSGRSGKDAIRRRITEREHRRTQRQIQRNTVRSAAKGEEVVSAQDIGYANGSTDKSLRVLPKSSYHVLDKESQKKVKNLEDKGYEVILVTSAYENDKGGLLTEINGRISRGAISGNKIYITADHWTLSVAQIADHEFFHSVLNNNEGLREKLWNKLIDKFDATEMLALQMAYANDYRWTDKSIEYIQDEILCDAFAGIDIFEDKDIFRLHVDNYTELVRTLTSEESAKGYTERGPDRMSEEPEPDVNTLMTMKQAELMIEKAWSKVKEWYEDDYRNARAWVEGEGSDVIYEQIYNNSDLYDKYIASNDYILDNDYLITDIVDAYLAGTLVGNSESKTKRLDVSKGSNYKDSKFYAPKHSNADAETYKTATQRVTKTNSEKVMKARRDILFAAHNLGFAESIGLTQSELNKKLNSWGRYPAKAIAISNKLNEGVAESNKWTGIENSSTLSKVNVTESEIESLVKEIKGSPSAYQKNYIGRAMLAIDTHVNWSDITFNFLKGPVDSNRRSVRGNYSDTDRTINIGGSSYADTVAHEMGHALDATWHRELFGRDGYLSDTNYVESLIKTEDEKQFRKNFKAFINSLTDVNDSRNDYTNDNKEVFARFVAKFVEWTDLQAGNSFYRESLGYNDKFTQAQYVEFVHLLQEKAKIDSAKYATNYSEESEAEYYRLAQEENELIKQMKEIESTDKYKNLIHDAMSTKDKAEQTRLLQEFADWTKEIGYTELANRRKEVSDAKSKAYRQTENDKAEARKKAIVEYRKLFTPEFAEKYAKKAERKYGTTTNYEKAAYLDVNGKLLDFSDGQRYRVQDHREISEILDFLPKESEYSDGLIEFMNMGNIRMQTYGIDISKAPNPKQILALKQFIRHLEGEITVDISDENGYNVDSIDYAEDTRPDRVVNDILRYFNEGIKPSEGSAMYSRLSEEIEPDMADEERYEILKDKSIVAVPSNRAAIQTLNLDALTTNSRAVAKKAIGKWGKDIFYGNDVNYHIESIDIDANYSGGSFKESISKQIDYVGNYLDFVIAVASVEDLLKHGILIEAHDNYKKEISPNIKSAYVILGVIEDEVLNDSKHEKRLIPVELLVKTDYKDESKLYITVALGSFDVASVKKIDHVVMDKGLAKNGSFPNLVTKSINTYTLRSVLENVNPKDEAFLKYIPDGFLNAEQLTGKQNGLESRNRHTEEQKRLKNKNRLSEETDAKYKSAVESGDMDTAQRMVDEAFMRAYPNTKMLKDGKPRDLYHGTNDNEFTKFDISFLGGSSGDNGFFGEGFYFAYSKGEASYYGRYVKKVYLNLTNPFNFEKELGTYDGKRASSGYAPDMVFAVNFAEKFPKFAKAAGDQIYCGKLERDMSLPEFASIFQKAYRDLEYNVSEYDGPYGKEWIVTADPTEQSYVDAQGKEHKWMDYEYDRRFIDKRSTENKLEVVADYLTEKYGIFDFPRSINLVMGSDFTNELIARGYDGAIQSDVGDEAVAYYPNQIKLADPATYDDNGNLIPLSERFNDKNEDIRFSEESDSTGRSLTEAQVRYFKDSKIRDKNGILIPMYHGSENAGFTVFNSEYGISSRFFFFTDSLDAAKGYSGTHDLFKVKDYSSIGELENYIDDAGYGDDYSVRKNGSEYELLDDRGNVEATGSLSDLQIAFDSLSGWGGGDASNYEVYLNITNPLVIDGKGNNWDEIPVPWQSDTMTTNAIAEYAYENGYDGIKVTNIFDIGLYNSSREYKPTNVVVAFEPNQIKLTSNLNPTDDADIRYSEEVTDDNTLKFLNDQINSGDYIVTYKSMRLDNGELHSPMAALINGKYENAYELGKWYQAVEHPELIKIDKNNGRPYFDLKKGKGANNKSLGTVPARYNPYEHSSNSVFNDQFKTAYKRPELVTVEMWIPKSELTSGYQAQYAKDPVGWTEWKSGEISNALAKAGKPRRDLMLSRWAMPHRILTNRETAEKLIDFIDGTDIKINAELVTPGVLGELAKLGANIEYTKIVPAPNYSEENLAADENRRLQAEVKKLQAKLALTQEQRDYWRRETTLSPKEAVNHTDVLRVTKDFIKKWDGTINASEISSDMQKLTELIYEGKLMDEILPPALDIAEKICDSARVITNDESYRNYLEIKKYFRTTPIKWVEGIGDPGFYKRNFGKIRFSKDERKVTVDAMWDEWQSRWGEEFFPSEVTTSQDKAEHIASIIDSLESLYENPYDSDFADAVEACANNLIFDIVNGGIRYTPIGNPTRADIAQAKYNKAIAEKNREIEEMRIANEDIAKQLNSEIRRLLAEADRTAQAHASEIAGYEANYTPNEIVENIVRDLWAKHSELTKTQIEMAAMQEFYRGREQKAQEKLKAVRQDRDEKLEALKQHYRDVVQRRRLRKAESEARQKLLKIARRLQNKKLPQVSRALLNQYIENLDTISVSITGAKLEKLADLQAAYLLQAENDPNFIKDPNIEKAIARLGQKRISELSIDEVVTLTNILLNIEKEIRDANKLIGIEDRRDVAEQAMETISNIKYSKGTKDNVKDWLVTSTLSPVRLIRRMTGYAENDPLYNAVNNLADGQRKMFDYQRRAYDMFKKWTTDKEYIKSLQEVMTISGWKDSKKIDVAITKDMAIALYMHSLNDQNLAHISEGGVTIPDIDVLKKNPANAYGQGSTRIKLTPSDVRGIIASLNEKDIAYAKAARTYFDSISTKEINEVSEALVGYSLAQVENYFPINTDSSFTRKDFDSIKMDGTIEGMGFLKERVNAKNPIYLRGFTDVLNKSIDMNSKYIGLAIPVRNFNKLWNATLSNGISGSYYDSSVKEAVNSKWGKRGTDYIEKMMADLQNPSRRQDELDGWLAKIRSNYAGAVLTLNMSVAMKQAASYPTAAAVLGWKPLAKAMGRFGKVDLDLINKYTPLLWYRSQGFADTELGDLKSRNKQIPKLLNWIQAADLATTRKLWKASEIYVADSTKLAKGSDEFYKAVAEIYNRVIEETQPNYTTMQRPQILRTDSSLVSTLVMFKTQPFQNFNVLYDAVGEYEALSKAKKNGAKVDLTQASKNVKNAFESQIVSLGIFAGMTMLWNMIRRRDEDYEDEQGKKTFLSVFKKLAADMISGATGMAPFGSNAYDELKSMFTDAKNYGFSSVTITAMNDALVAISDITHDISDAIDAKRNNKEYDWIKFMFKTEDRLENIAKLFGVPLENVVNLFRAGYNWASVIEYGEYYGEYKSMMVTYLPTSSNAKSKYYNLLYKAKGTSEYNKIRNEMIKSGYFTEKGIADAMKKRSK